MNTEELIVMGVLMILAGGLMVARHFVHTMEIPAPMATRKARKEVDTDFWIGLPDNDDGNTEEDLPINAAIAEALDVGDKQIATLKQRIFAQDRRIGKLEERHHYHVERQVLDYEALERRIAKLED
tara:strand:+ start:350 stop:727 length:378 start_codon:yes stop_codon:yes gene_type:complete